MAMPALQNHFLLDMPSDILRCSLISYLSINERVNFSKVSKECSRLVQEHLFIKVRDVSQILQRIYESDHCSEAARETLTSIEARMITKEDPTFPFLFSCFYDLAKGPLFIERALLFEAIKAKKCPIYEELNDCLMVRAEVDRRNPLNRNWWLERQVKACVRKADYRHAFFYIEFMKECDQGYFYIRTVSQLCKLDQCEQASLFMERIGDEEVKSQCLKNLCVSLSKQKKIDLAIREVRKITKKETLRYTLNQIFYETLSQNERAHIEVIQNLLFSCV
ncbi:MAG: F-box protein [Waddliaceae bacterium]